MESDFKEYPLIGSEELGEGEMKQIEVGGQKIVAARVEGKVHAVGGTCPHYGGPLAEGMLCGRRLICPWHQGTFDVTSGELLEPPPLDCIPKYETRVEGGRVLVRLPEKGQIARRPEMAKGGGDSRALVIVGAGAAGVSAAQTLRREGFCGRVVMVSREGELPYDRPNLTKEYLAEKPFDHSMLLREEKFYEEAGIERMARNVTEVDAGTRVVKFADGGTLRGDAILLATGGEPRKLNVPGEELGNVFLVRSRGDVDRLRESARRFGGGSVVVIGSSFIGMECAASLRERGMEVMVVSPAAVPFEKQLGAEVGGVFRKLHEEKGVRFRMSSRAMRMEGDGTVRAVVLETGKRIEAGMVVIGVGVRPATGYVRGLELEKDGAIRVDERLRASEGVFAAGDIARFMDARTGKMIRIEHWRVAEQQGQVAARNMLGRGETFAKIPYFWSFQLDVGLDYFGHVEKWEAVKIEGDLAGRDFIAYYVEGGRVQAAAGMNRSGKMQGMAELWRRGKFPSAEELMGAKDLGAMACGG